MRSGLNKLGLKLWSTNTDFYYDEAEKLYHKGVYHYIELYVVPNTLDSIKKWQKLQIPFTLHAPHFAHGVNLADKEKEALNKKIFEEVKLFSKELSAEYIVVHGGIEGDIDETIRQLNIIQLENMLIENKPYRAPLGEKKLCRGATIEEVQKVLDNVHCGFCLDVGHAMCTANSFDINPYQFLSDFNNLNPVCYHLSDNFTDSQVDAHLHFGQGNYDFAKILQIIDNEKNIAIETNKESKISLKDFEKDVYYIENIGKVLK